MEVQEFPTSTFEGKIIENIDYTASGEQTVRAKGTLFIHGVEQERIIKGTVLRKGDNLVIKAAFTVPLEEHNIKIPKVVYQKIAGIIEVKIEAELTPKAQ
jgi:polyisoprenoid-binding protein YceI